jgi:NADH-quinone oxidoreductase subunit M
MILTHGSENRRHAAVKFIAYSIASSLALLLGILVLYSAAHTFDIASLAQSASLLSTQTQLIALVLFLFALMIKIPVFPFHNWLPEAHTQAPTTGSMILAGVMLKFGGYGLIILAGILPIMFHYGLYLFALFAFSSIFSALVIARQNNLKKAIAYSSITEMAIVGVGILANTQQALTGATYLMLAHAISVSILFLAAGIVNESYGTLEIKSLNGITRNFRRLTYLFIFGAFAAIGIPLTAGFIGDILTFVGSYTTFGLLGLVPLAAILILGGIFFWIIDSVFMSGDGSVPVKQIERKAYVAGVFLAVCAVLLGILPFLVI